MYFQNKMNIFGALIAMLLCWQAGAQGYEVTFKIDGLQDGDSVSLMPYGSYEMPAEAVAVAKKGKVIFTGELEGPREYQIKINDKWAYYQFMIENAKISIKAKAEEITTPRAVYFQLNDVEVKGSESHDYFLTQMAVRKDLNKIYEENNAKYAEVSALVGKAREKKDSVMMDSVMNLPAYKAMSQADKDFFAEVSKRYEEVFVANKETFWGPLMMMNLYSYFSPEVRPQFEMMSDEAKESHYGKIVFEQLYPVDKAGTAVPTFVTKDRAGNKVSLEQLRSGKKAILIDFWASWCGPCKKEIPNLKENYASFADQGFEIVSISIDQSEAAWVKALEKNELPWPNFLDRDVSALYKVSAVPTTYLIDGEGILIAENLRGEELTAKLQEIFEN